ncbi:MAG: hypothetical protein ACI358_00715 [Candidatus Limimorpha sp.]
MKINKLSLLLISLVFVLSSCSTTKLYYWGGNKNNTTKYEEMSYRYYKTHSPESLCNVFVVYHDVIENPGGGRMVPPPGMCAEFAFLLVDEQCTETFMNNASEKQKDNIGRTDFFEYGIELLNKEMEYYPESKQFLEPILNRIQNKE